MPMITADEVTPRAIRAVMPDCMKGRKYKKFAEGMEITIESVAFSVYAKRDEEGEEIIRKDGSVVHKMTAYVGYDGGRYATVGNEFAIGQLFSITDVVDENAEGVSEFPDIEPCKVKITTKDIKYGDKTFPSWVFIPME